MHNGAKLGHAAGEVSPLLLRSSSRRDPAPRNARPGVDERQSTESRFKPQRAAKRKTDDRLSRFFWEKPVKDLSHHWTAQQRGGEGAEDLQGEKVNAPPPAGDQTCTYDAFTPVQLDAAENSVIFFAAPALHSGRDDCRRNFICTSSGHGCSSVFHAPLAILLQAGALYTTKHTRTSKQRPCRLYLQPLYDR